MISLQQAQIHSPKIRRKTIFWRSLGKTIGDIPVYSLNKIRVMLSDAPIGIKVGLQALLVEKLERANAQYQAVTGNHWNCLTSNDLVSAIQETDRAFEETIRGVTFHPGQEVFRERVLGMMNQRREESMLVIQRWVLAHYDDLLYDMTGKVPWPVVLSLKSRLSFWIDEKRNPFGADIEEFTLGIAREAGIETDNFEFAWEKLGGRVYIRKS